MTQPWRVAGGTWLDRGKPLTFSFNGQPLQGFEGDTLASALLANGVRVVGRSFKYHRPRGVVALGSEEPNALLRLVDADGGGRPNSRATTVALVDGLIARSQHHWPSLQFDIGALVGQLGRFLSAGFYYKTFMWPRRWWPAYEHVLRHAAGLGAPPDRRQHTPAAQRNAHVDVLIAGGGPAGLAAALAAGRAGASVLLADDGAAPGGMLLDETDERHSRWLAATLDELRAMRHVTLLPRSVVTGYYDHDFLTLVQPASGTLWKVRATRVVLATGAIERPLMFAGNDRPGVMLAGAVLGYLRRYAVLCGREIVFCTSNDSVYAIAQAVAAAGARVAAVLDLRPEASAAAAAAKAAGVHVVVGATVLGTEGRGPIRAVRWADARGDASTTACDLLAMAGGWTPRVHLFSQARGTLRYDSAIAGFVPQRTNGANASAGACNGVFDADDCIAEGMLAGVAAAQAANGGDATLAFRNTTAPHSAAAATTAVPTPHAKAFVDFQNDVTVGDVLLAAREGYRSVEHLKRYTTLGMGTDQGKLSNLNGLTLLAAQTGQAPGQVGTTTFRPPYVPIEVSTLAGLAQNHPAHAARRLATHEWHAAHGAVFTSSAVWLRPQFYRRAGESDLDAVNREVLAVRNGVGLIDVSPLGKVELQGRDAAELLNRLYVNRWNKLGIGRAKFGIVLREDGMVLDDSVVARLGEHHYVMSTSTAHSKTVPEHIAYCLHTLWPDLRVHVTPVSEQWATFALAGRLAREVLLRLSPDFDASAAAMPHMSVRSGTLLGITARVARMSFSGELSYEISVPAERALHVWQALVAAGQPHGLTVYGTEAMGVLRIEKGHFVVGREAAGTVTLDDLGLSSLLDRSKDCIGMRSLALPALTATDRLQMVGVKALDAGQRIAPGAHIVARGDTQAQASLGHMSSQCHSPMLGGAIGLAMVQGGRARIGQTLFAVSPVTNEVARVALVEPCFVDPEGARLHA